MAYVGDFHRVPEVERDLVDRELMVENLDLVADPDGEVDYLGESQAPAVDLVPEDMGDPSQLQGRSGHHYSGTFPGGQDREALDDTFDLWIRDDGYPLQFQFTGGGGIEGAGVPVTLNYVDFDHPVEIEVPDESELVDAPPPTDAPPPAD